jgi:hypothetical protein
MQFTIKTEFCIGLILAIFYDQILAPVTIIYEKNGDQSKYDIFVIIDCLVILIGGFLLFDSSYRLNKLIKKPDNG